MGYVYVNGKLLPSEEASVAIDNRAFRYGYGLFETMLVRQGQIMLAELHWQRLLQGMEQLHFAIPKTWTTGHLQNEVLTVVKKNKLEKLCRVRLQVYAGKGGLYDGLSQLPECVIECFPIEQHITQLNENGLVLGIAEGLQKSRDILANLKTTNALIYTQAAIQAQQNKWNDAFIINTDGHILESTIANIFLIKDGILYTPPLSDGCVAGTMRRWLMDKLPSLGYRIVEQSLHLADLETCDEILLTNAIRRLKWVREIGTYSYTNTTIKKIENQLFSL